MQTEGMTAKVLLGMVLGAIAGVLLMFYSPTGLQAGDVIELTGADGQTTTLTLAAANKSKSTAEVALPGGQTGEVVLDQEAVLGTVVTGEGETVSLLGLQPSEALATLQKADPSAGYTAIKLTKRSAVKVLPPATQVFYVIGELFIRLLKMLIVPLIVATVLIGIASLGSVKKMGNIGVQTMLLYGLTMIAAATIGIIVVNLVKPGAELNWEMPAGFDANGDRPTIPDLLLRIIPTNPIEAMANLDVLGILFFTILTAFAMLALGKHRIAPVFNFFEALNDLVYKMISWVMALAPLGVGALIAYFIGIQSPQLLGLLLESLGLFALCVVIGLTTHFIVLMLLVRFLGKYPVGTFLKKMAPAMATAFGTDSSSATLPVTMTSVRDMGVSKRIAGFVVSVGATANMNGTALYEATAVLFFAQAYNADLTLGQQVIVAITAMLAAVGAAGIPSAGLVTMALVLTAVNLPLAGIGLLFAIDRPLDMMRTVVNVCDDAAASRVIQTLNPDIKPEEDDVVTEYEPLDPAASRGD
ncbi:MAG: dicarboxylate/amino acid:cation symporter [Fimbriimonadaceae bacterium]|uniref:Na+/H+ C4-dicarboxylate symporter n=1 Tax=Candidatus Nitrosymbiomonas proteolyticus TaxID=2608984 RepID=A0A809SDG9_9BACT|nr:dicarboxylate/amino acid:cation symporter [Fimbriimonadaceae bacterium]NUM38269.1 dicarboxylate/amino acid:cation symporter [Armatimonadota bacterium]BBO23014.1 Na+/H+ C4-dicarboxylate symporter [Candidatus Nitrosymbiomonas proteolyticus]